VSSSCVSTVITFHAAPLRVNLSFQSSAMVNSPFLFRASSLYS
jgi:hypothetical protein